MRRLIIGITGASGVIYGIRLLEILQSVSDCESHLVMTKTAKLNITIETDKTVAEVEALADEVHNDGNLASSISSGSFQTAGMIVAPCSIRSLSGIVHSSSDTLVTRAADVVLKERRQLVLLPRETPLHVGHCKLLYEAASLGAVIVPPVPAFYNRPKSIDDIVNHTVGRTLDLFDVDTQVVDRWPGK